MNLLGYLYLFTTLLLQAASFHCPSGSFQIPNEDICIFTIMEHNFYLNAVRKCESLGGIVVKLENLFENSYVFATITQTLNNQAPYIGVERNEKNEWTYADGSPLTYQNWALNEPNSLTNTSVCAIMNPQTGTWLAADCFLTRPFLCSINGDNFQCPSGWVYHKTDAIDHCYYVQDFTYPDAVHWQMYNFSVAEANCRRMNSHLVSIHSKEEDDFVYGLITSNVKTMTTAVPDGKPCLGQQAWIGYYGSGILGVGAQTWTDGSAVDYIGVYGTQTSTVAPWLMSNDPSCTYTQWLESGLSNGHARFVCKKPSKNQILKEKRKENQVI